MIVIFLVDLFKFVLDGCLEFAFVFEKGEGFEYFGGSGRDDANDAIFDFF